MFHNLIPLRSSSAWAAAEKDVSKGNSMLRKGIFSWYGYESHLSNRLKLIAGVGFNSTCIWFGNIEKSYKDGTLGEMIKLARKLGLFVDNVHAPINQCNYIWSDKTEERNIIFGILCQCIYFCSNNGIPNVVIHISSGNNPPRFCESGLALLQQLIDLAKQEGVVIAVENCRKREHFDYVFSNLESENLGFCYDSSHDALWGKPSIDILKKWGEKLVTLHLSDNQGVNDDHWLPGEGIVQWEAVIQLLNDSNYNGSIMLEVVPKNLDAEMENDFLKRTHKIACKFVDSINPADC